jgi:hypothetical protein
MAGFAVALNGHVYEGEYQASEALTNGMFAYITGGKVAKLAGTKDTYLRIVRKFQQWGLYWLEAIVTDSQDDEIYFVENEWDITDTAAFNEETFACAANDYVRMRRLAVGDHVAFSVTAAQYARQKVGNVTQPGANGLVLPAPEIPVLSTDLEDTDAPTIGGSYTLLIATTVADGGSLSYQWYKGGVAVNGATNTTLVLNPYATATHDGAYYCIVTNTLNSMTNSTQSNTITLAGEA